MLESWDEYTNTPPPPLKLKLTLQDEISLIYDKIPQWEYLILGGGSLNSIERLLALGLLHFLKLLRGKLDVSLASKITLKEASLSIMRSPHNLNHSRKPKNLTQLRRRKLANWNPGDLTQTLNPKPLGGS